MGPSWIKKTLTSSKNNQPKTVASAIVIIAAPGNAKATGNPEPKAAIMIRNRRRRKYSSIVLPNF